MEKYNPVKFSDVKKEHLQLDVGDSIIPRKEIILSGKITIKKHNYYEIYELDSLLDFIWIKVGDKLWDMVAVVLIPEDLDVSNRSILFHENFYTEKEYLVECRKNKIYTILNNK